MASENLTYLALGDSYTIGEAVEYHETFPVQLALRVRQKGLSVEFPHVIAKTGWTSGELLAAIDQESLSVYDMVTLLVGVNDQYRGYPINEYREQFFILVKKAVELAKGDAGRVFVLSIPDWGVTPFAEGKNREQIRKEINEYNQINLEETIRAGCHYIQITDISRQVPLFPDMLAKDQLHPSRVMYGQWVDAMLSQVVQALKQ